MFIDTAVFLDKIDTFKEMFDESIFQNLPSCREARIQVQKWQRMVDAFQKKFPLELLTSTPPTKLGKMRSADVRRIVTQMKLVERAFMTLIEEHIHHAAVAQDLSIPKKRLRGPVQKYVHRLNSLFRRPFDRKALTAAHIAFRDDIERSLQRLQLKGGSGQARDRLIS